MVECNKCAGFNLTYRRSFVPEEFIEGDPASPVWIIGLNPASPKTDAERRAEDDLSALQINSRLRALARAHPYFKNFQRVSTRLHLQMGEPNGVAHTDIVKCASRNWPPKGCKGKDAQTIVANCTEYLQIQLKTYRPRLLICNGADASEYIQQAVPPIEALRIDQTNYVGRLGDQETRVVLAGFVGRIDNFARLRLGREIDELIATMGLPW